MADDGTGEPSDAAIEALATALLHLEAGHDVAGAVAIGERVLAELFHGDLDAFGSQDPGKPSSVNRLAAACRRSRSWVTDRVRVSTQYPRYDAPFRDQVSLSVHVALLRAPEIERNQLLRQAAMQGLSAYAVDHLIHRLVDPDAKPEPPARPSPFAKVLENEDKLVAAAERATDPAKRAELLEQARSGRALFARLERILAKPPKPAQASRATPARRRVPGKRDDG